MTHRQRGFGPPVELLFFVVAIALATAAWLPQLTNRDVRTGRNACARALDAALTSPTARGTCPISGRAYAPRVLAGSSESYLVRCPTPEVHGLEANTPTLSAQSGLGGYSAVSRFPPPMSWPTAIGGWLASVVGGIALVAAGSKLLSRIR